MVRLKILHVASHEINVGDGALNSAIQATFQRLAPCPVDFERNDVAVFREEITASVADRHDLVIVGGGGGISNGPFAARSGTALPMSLKDYAQTRTPFAFLGLGHNLFTGERLTYASELAALLDLVRTKGDSFAVRNDGSLARLRDELGEPACEGIVEVPDPGFFVEAPTRHPVELGNRPFALIQVAGDSIGLRLPVSRLKRLFDRVKTGEPVPALSKPIVDVALHLWQHHGLDILLAPHIHHDVPLCASIMRQLYAKAGRAALHRPFRVGGTPHPAHATAFFGGYRAARVIIGMRGHSVICGVGLRCPTIALSSHAKVEGFMQDCGLRDWSVRLRADAGQELIERCDQLLRPDNSYMDVRDRMTASFTRTFDAEVSKALLRAQDRHRSRGQAG